MNGRDEQDDQQHENGRTVEDGLAEPVRLHRERRERHRRDGERSPGENLAMIGALGWLVVTPTLIGTFAGRWIDRMQGSGIFWTSSLLFIGLCLGCWLAWKRMHQ